MSSYSSWRYGQRQPSTSHLPVPSNSCRHLASASRPPAFASPNVRSSDDVVMPRHKGARKRVHAQRTCLACRKRKVRCQLGSADVVSSKDALPEEDKCVRCKNLNVECIVYDGDRKSARYTLTGADKHQVTLSPSAASSSSLNRLEQTSPQAGYPHPSSADTRSDNDDEVHGTDVVDHAHRILSPFVPFWPTQSSSTGTETQGASSSSLHSADTTPQQTGAGRSDSLTHNQAASHLHDGTLMDQNGGARSAPHRKVPRIEAQRLVLVYSPNALWLQMMSQSNTIISGRHRGSKSGAANSHASGSEHRPTFTIERALSAIADSAEGQADIAIAYQGILLLHPHLPPSAETIFAQYESHPTTSRVLLVATCLLLCCQSHRCSMQCAGRQCLLASRALYTSLQDIARSSALRILLNPPREIEAVQGMILLAVHEPFLLADDSESHVDLTSNDVSAPDGSSNPAFAMTAPGASPLAVAMAIGRALGLERLGPHPAPSRYFPGLQPSLSDENKQRNAVLWMSLCCWATCLSINDGQDTVVCSSYQPEHATFLHEQNWTSTIKSMRQDSLSGLAVTSSLLQQVNDAIRQIGMALVLARAELLTNVSTLRADMDRGLEQCVSDTEIQETCQRCCDRLSQQSSEIVNGFSVKVEELSSIHKQMCGHERKRAGPLAAHLLTAIRQAEAWISFEAAALETVASTTALCAGHMWRTRKTDTAMVSAMRLHSDPIWGPFFGRHGIQRFQESEQVLALAARLSAGAGAFRSEASLRASIQLAGAAETEAGLGACLPLPMVTAAYVTFATKCIIDTQIGILDGWRRTSERTDSLSVLVQCAADLLLSQSSTLKTHARSKPEGRHGKQDAWSRTSAIVALMADLMDAWQRGARRQKAIEDIEAAKRRTAEEFQAHTEVPPSTAAAGAPPAAHPATNDQDSAHSRPTTADRTGADVTPAWQTPGANLDGLSFHESLWQDFAEASDLLALLGDSLV